MNEILKHVASAENMNVITLIFSRSIESQTSKIGESQRKFEIEKCMK